MFNLPDIQVANKSEWRNVPFVLAHARFDGVHVHLLGRRFVVARDGTSTLSYVELVAITTAALPVSLRVRVPRGMYMILVSQPEDTRPTREPCVQSWEQASFL